jgi:GxxExxY protein
LLVEKKVILELKVPGALDSVCEKQLLNCLGATNVEVGIPFNFSTKAEFKWYVFDNEKKKKSA